MGLPLHRAKLLPILLLLLVLAGVSIVKASCQELAYELRLGEKGVVDFTLVIGDEWSLSKPLMIGYSLAVKSNVSIIGVLRLVAKCGDKVSFNDYLLGLAEPQGRLSGLITAKPTTSLLSCTGNGYVVLEPTLMLYELGGVNGSNRVYSYRLSPLIVKLLNSTEPIQIASCRVSIANGTALELCAETLQPWTPLSSARVLLSLRSTRALESVTVGVKADGWLLSSRVVDLSATSAHTWVFVGQQVLAALWREGRELTLTAYADANKLLVEAPLKIMLKEPSIGLMVDVKPLELVAGVPSTIEITISNTGIKDVLIKKIELLVNETKSIVEVDRKVSSLGSVTVKHRVLVNKTGHVNLTVKVHYVVSMGIPGTVEKKLDLKIVSPLKILAIEPVVVGVNGSVKVLAISQVGSNNATLLAYPINGGSAVILARGLQLNRGAQSVLEFSARLRPGEYLVKLVDEHGYESNPLKLKVIKLTQAKKTELNIVVTPLQLTVEANKVAEVRVVVSPPQNATFKLYRLVEMPKPQWLLERLLDVVEESPGVYIIKYKAPSKTGVHVYKLIVKANGVEKEATFTLKVEEPTRTSFQLQLAQQLTKTQSLLPNWALFALIGVSIAGGAVLFRKYSRGV